MVFRPSWILASWLRRKDIVGPGFDSWPGTNGTLCFTTAMRKNTRHSYNKHWKCGVTKPDFKRYINPHLSPPESSFLLFRLHFRFFLSSLHSSLPIFHRYFRSLCPMVHYTVFLFTIVDFLSNSQVLVVNKTSWRYSFRKSWISSSSVKFHLYPPIFVLIFIITYALIAYTSCLLQVKYPVFSNPST